MHINENTDRADLEIIILENDELYNSLFGGDKLNNKYETSELLEAVQTFIEEGDETFKI